MLGLLALIGWLLCARLEGISVGIAMPVLFTYVVVVCVCLRFVFECTLHDGCLVVVDGASAEQTTRDDGSPNTVCIHRRMLCISVLSW